jgi:hypothetical protein
MAAARLLGIATAALQPHVAEELLLHTLMGPVGGAGATGAGGGSGVGGGAVAGVGGSSSGLSLEQLEGQVLAAGG